MTGTEEQLSDALHGRVDHRELPSTPMGDVVATAGRIRRRRRVRNGVVTAAVVAVLATPFVLDAVRQPDTGPAPADPRGPTRPAPRVRLDDVAMGKPPAIAWMDGRDYVAADGTRTTFPVGQITSDAVRRRVPGREQGRPGRSPCSTASCSRSGGVRMVEVRGERRRPAYRVPHQRLPRPDRNPPPRPDRRPAPIADRADEGPGPALEQASRSVSLATASSPDRYTGAAGPWSTSRTHPAHAQAGSAAARSVEERRTSSRAARRATRTRRPSSS